MLFFFDLHYCFSVVLGLTCICSISRSIFRVAAFIQNALSLLEIAKLHLISWCGNFERTQCFCKVSGNSCETVRFYKTYAPGNQMKVRYFMEFLLMLFDALDEDFCRTRQGTSITVFDTMLFDGLLDTGMSIKFVRSSMKCFPDLLNGS